MEEKIKMLLLTCALLFPGIPSGYSRLWFDTGVDPATGEFIADVGDSVDLYCSPRPWWATNVDIYRVYHGTFRLLSTWIDDYGDYTTTIGPITPYDSGQYLCQYYYLACSGPWRQRVCQWTNVKYFATLYVIPPVSDQRCFLAGNTSGIFFVGDDIVLRCTGINESDGLVISIDDGTDSGEDDYSIQYRVDNATDSLLVTIPGIARVYNTATMTCMIDDDDDDDDDIDLCRNITAITVLAELEVMLSPTRLRVPNHGNATCFCRSELSLLASFDWDIVDDGVSFVNTSMVPTDGGMSLHLIGIDFANSTSKTIHVSCNITVGTRNVIRGTASVSELEDVTTPSMASSAPTSSQNRSPNGPLSGSAVVVVAPLVAGLALVCVIAAALIWFRRSSSEGTGGTTKVADRKSGLDAESEPKNVYTHDWKSGGARLGYSSPDAEVVDNVAYVPYSGENP